MTAEDVGFPQLLQDLSTQRRRIGRLLSCIFESAWQTTSNSCSPASADEVCVIRKENHTTISLYEIYVLEVVVYVTLFSTAAPESRVQPVTPLQGSVDHDDGAQLTQVHTPYSTSDMATLTIEICRSLSDRCKTEGKFIRFILCVEHSVADLDLCTEPKPEVDDVRLPEKEPVTCSESAGLDANKRKVSQPKRRKMKIEGYMI